MEDANARPKLPALNFLDAKREDDAQPKRSARHGLSMSESPTYHYPPPPYSQIHNALAPTQHANNRPVSQLAVHTPPESRRTSENEQESVKQTRQSLPSISEALGVDSQTSFASTHATPPSFPTPLLPQTQSVSQGSPSPKSRRSHPMEPSPGHSTSLPGSHYAQYSQYRSEPAPQQQPHSATADAPRAPAAYPSVSEMQPSLHLQTSQPPSRSGPPPNFPRASEPSPTHERSAPPAGAMGPPSSFSYGYAPYPPRYANPTPPSSVTSAPAHQPSGTYTPQSATSGWKGETNSRFDERQPEQSSYGESVKRHLDFYDLEVALNEIASTSGILSDFSRRYGDQMHHTQRSGAALSSLPGLVEVDDMVAKTRVQLDSLLKIRDVIITQQQALFEQQAADRRQQHKAFNEPPLSQPLEHHSAEGEDAKSGSFPNTDTKKRRGRAAPPGRCHSCNRAETPEWRRGPDGARTLCNACGLHYAKLTRKNNGANKNTMLATSNLRPKESLPQQ